MKYRIKKKLIHFYTSGNVAEDFVASRRKKVSVMRKIIRACFYLHCAAALLCIGLSILLGSGLEVVLITLFTVGAAGTVRRWRYPHNESRADNRRPCVHSSELCHWRVCSA